MRIGFLRIFGIVAWFLLWRFFTTKKRPTNKIASVKRAGLHHDILRITLSACKNIGTILSILEDVSDDNLVFSPYSDGVIISLKDTNLAIRTITGTFPDYKQLFPKSYIFKVNLNKSEIINALQLTTFIALNYAFCNIKSEKEKNILKITSKENSVGSTKKSLKVEFEQEENDQNFDDFEVNYNSNYFLDGLQKINNEKIKINFTTVARPAFISSPEDVSFIYLLMPLNR